MLKELKVKNYSIQYDDSKVDLHHEAVKREIRAFEELVETRPDFVENNMNAADGLTLWVAEQKGKLVACID